MGSKESAELEVADRFGRLVLTIAWRILGDDEDANDVYQDTFLSYFAMHRKGEEILQPKAWRRGDLFDG